MKEDNGNYLSLNNDDSDDDSYKTPPETIKTESEDNPNAPEILMKNLRMIAYSTMIQS